MNRKVFGSLSFFALGMFCLMAAPAWSADRVGLQGAHFQKRIAQGVKSGEITRPELARLRQEQRHIRRFSHQARSDGHVNQWERRNLQRMKQEAHRSIYRARHNRASNYCVKRSGGHHRSVVHRAPATRYNHGFISGTFAQPGLSVAWDVGLR
jgi:hypothetical protein